MSIPIRLRPGPRHPDPLFDDFIPGRLIALMRKVRRRGGATATQADVMVRLLKKIDPRLEPLVDDIVSCADGADGCVIVFMDLVGPEVAVGATLVFRLLGAKQADCKLAWRLAEQKAFCIPLKGSATQIAERLLGVP